jgi:proteasome lid subunit RPN8/RPN11
MIAHAVAELPNECCGLLAGPPGQNGEVAEATHRYALINELSSPTEFHSEPRSMLAAVKDMRTKGIDVLAVYHSHPSSEPIPSKRDLERNYCSQVMNLIVGLASASPKVAGWWLTESDFLPAEWVVC